MTEAAVERQDINRGRRHAWGEIVRAKTCMQSAVKMLLPSDPLRATMEFHVAMLEMMLKELS